MSVVETESLPPKEENTTDTLTGVAVATSVTTTPNEKMFGQFFHQKTQFFRDVWTQHKMKLPRDHSFIIFILLICLVPIVCCIAALTTNAWICDSSECYSLWNTCFTTWSDEVTFNITLNQTNETVWDRNWIHCVRQGIHSVITQKAEQPLIDQISVAQGLILCGLFFYIFSVVSIMLSYRFINYQNNHNMLRNSLFSSLFIQIIAFLLFLTGFFFYIYNENFSLSVVLLFFYFGIGIFATNIINFITVEYKTFKNRQTC